MHIHSVIHTVQESNSEDGASLDYENSPLQHSSLLVCYKTPSVVLLCMHVYTLLFILFRSQILKMMHHWITRTLLYSTALSWYVTTWCKFEYNYVSVFVQEPDSEDDPSLDQSPFADCFLQYRATLVYNIHYDIIVKCYCYSIYPFCSCRSQILKMTHHHIYVLGGTHLRSQITKKTTIMENLLCSRVPHRYVANVAMHQH